MVVLSNKTAAAKLNLCGSPGHCLRFEKYMNAFTGQENFLYRLILRLLSVAVNLNLCPMIIGFM